MVVFAYRPVHSAQYLIQQIYIASIGVASQGEHRAWFNKRIMANFNATLQTTFHIWQQDSQNHMAHLT